LALNLPDHLPDEIKAKRLSKVLCIQDEITLKRNKELVGKELEILVDGKSKNNEDIMTGRTRTNKVVNFRGKTDLIGKLLNLRIVEARHHSLYGETL